MDYKKDNDSNVQIFSDLFIIGVGASAGGLEAMYALFEHPGPDNASFIIVQHLPHDFKSNMATLLANHSKRKILEVKNNMAVEPNSVYVLTERKGIVLRNGLLLTSDDLGEQPNYLIDGLLKSLAQEKAEKSIAIILSGANNDGTQGAEAIKEAGGMVIVQDPATSPFDAMPNSVIASGNSDVVLAPELIIDELIHYIKEGTLSNEFKVDNEATLQEVLGLVSGKTQLNFANYKRATIIRRIARRLEQHKLNSLEDYIPFLKENPDEIDALSKEFMISVTKFFRDSGAFEIVRDKVLPEIIDLKLHETVLKIWVIGCATGEEAYSIAMLVHEYLEKTGKHLEVKIFASDIDQNALTVASKGIYPESIVQDVSEERISKFFYKEGNKFRIKENIRSMLIFSPHDITKHPPYYKLDFISCRNVLIYMNPVLQAKILSTLHYCLNLGGYLFLGPSENIGSLKVKMSEIDKKWKIYKNISAAVNLENGTFSPPRHNLNPISKQNTVLKASKNEMRTNLNGIISEVILHDFGYAGVCVDESFKVLQTFGEYNKFLLPELFNFNLLEMLPKELSMATAISLRSAIKENKDIRVKEITFKQKENLRSVDLLVKPLSETKSSEKIIMVLFNEQIPERQESETTEVFHNKAHFERYIAHLEEELKDKEEKLKEAYEELEESNGNAQAYNEELISGNEELQSTNEEVQSINEELQTVNNQYQGKIKELAELNDDLNNYFRSSENSQIYIDKNLIIRKFTPPTMKQVNIKETDIGRPIGDISTNIKFSTFIEDINAVVTSLASTEKEIQTTDEKWYQMKIIPYIRLEDNIADGVVIVFNDITDLKISQKKLTKINEDHNTFIYSVSHDLRAPVSNISGLISAMNNIIENTISEHDNQKLKKLSNLISASADRLQETIIELTDITKIEKESSEDISEKINLNDLLNEIKLGIKEMLETSKSKITVDFQEPEISFSKKNLRSILYNLLTNAIKYKSVDRDPEITIKTEKSGNSLVLSIKDNGRGISNEHKNKLFTMFRRGHHEINIEGTGIGLYLIKKMIENAGGKIEVESEKGKGSTFIVSFKI